MADFNIKSKRDEEIESLAMNLRRNKLASSDSEARRMAEEMLSTSKKVQQDFAEREKRIYGDQSRNPEVELAHKQMEQLASNIAQGKHNIRIDIPELDVNKPLKDIVGDDSDYEKEDDEEVVVKGEPQEEVKEESGDESGEEGEPDEAEPEEESPEEITVDEEPGDVGPGDAPEEPVRVDEDDDSDDDTGDDSDDDTGDDSDEKPENDAPIDDTEKEEASDDSEGQGNGEDDFSVKELDNSEQLRKSEEERKVEVARMEESKINLSNMFNVNK
jgi:hypothetical protein